MAANPFGLYDKSVGGGKLAGKYQKAWVEDALDIEESTTAHLAMVHTKNFIGASVSQERIYIVMLLIGIGLMVILGRISYLQLYKGNYYRSLAENNRLRQIPILAERGIMYDRNGKQLVQNIPNFSLVVTPEDLPTNAGSRSAVIARLAAVSGMSADDVVTVLNKYKSYNYGSVTLKENLDYKTALQLYIDNADLPGMTIERGSKRRYTTTLGTTNTSTASLSLSHLVGYLGKNDADLATMRASGYLPTEQIGKLGLEKTYEDLLRGTNGNKNVEVNARGQEQNTISVDPPEPGNNMYLTLDSEAQLVLENAVKNESAIIGKKRIAAVAMNPKNGEIIAMVSWPSFDSNDFANGIPSSTYAGYRDNPDRPLFNRTIAGTYPPGSNAKIVVAAAALQDGVITKNTTMNSVGGMDVGGIFFRDWKVGGHGITNVVKALAQSVNSFFYYVGGGYKDFRGLGIDKLDSYMAAFGIGKKTGVDLPGENAGLLPNDEWKRRVMGEKWYVGDTYNLSIGEGHMLVTPLQNAVWTAAIANGGNVVTPHFGLRMYNPTTEESTTLTYPAPHPTGVSLSNIRVVQEGMRACVVEGSCITLKSLPFSSAGKTGTAQWNKNKENHGWFTAYAPYENPQIVVTVLVEEGGEGAYTARPIAKEFLAWWGKKYLHS